METMCDLVRAQTFKSFGEDTITDWIFSSKAPSSCSVRTDRFVITFFLDERDESVSFSIIFLNVDQEDQDELYSHILAKVFPDINWLQGESRHVSDRIADEVENLKTLLRSIDARKLSGRDMLYFYLGYNAAYTDFMSGD